VRRSRPQGEAQDVPSTSRPVHIAVDFGGNSKPPDDESLNGGPVGPLATIVCKPRQGRKAATVVNDSGAGMWLAGLPPYSTGVLSGCSQPDSPLA